MYEEIISYVQKVGKTLVKKSGKIEDIGVKKDWLTKQDIEIEEELVKMISNLPGNHRVYAEEENNIFLEAENNWIIDPISGTFNYIHGLPHYAIVISHIKDGEIQFGLVYDPSMDELFTAEKGKGTYLNGERCYVNKSKDPKPAILFKVSELSDQYKSENIDILDKLLDIGPVKDIGSYGLHYAYVAAGRVALTVHRLKDVFPEYAGKILVEEAGGVFTNFQGEALNLKSKSAIASSGEMYDRAIQELSGFIKS